MTAAGYGPNRDLSSQISIAQRPLTLYDWHNTYPQAYNLCVHGARKATTLTYKIISRMLFSFQ